MFSQVSNINEGFDDINSLAGKGWIRKNQSQPLGPNRWFQGNADEFVAFDGDDTSYIGVNFNSITGTAATISNWLITPELQFSPDASFSFYTRKKDYTLPGHSDFPDRLEVRLSIVGASIDVGATALEVGDFSELKLSTNPNLVKNVYPVEWTQYTITGLPQNGSGRIALRYFVTEAGVDVGGNGVNSDYIGIDRVQYQSSGVPVYEIGGTVSGLQGSGLILQNNNGDDLNVTTDGSFNFDTSLEEGDTYQVTVYQQPSAPAQICTLNQATGTVATTNISSIAVVCKIAVAKQPIPAPVNNPWALLLLSLSLVVLAKKRFFK